MKLTLGFICALLALSVCAAETVKVSATTTGLDEDEKAIVEGFLELVTGMIATGGDVDKMQGILGGIKSRVEKKIKSKGATYLDKLAKTLTKVNIDEDDLNAIINSLNVMAEKDGVDLHANRPQNKKLS